MNNFGDLVRFEYKKIFMKRSIWIALFLYIFTIVVSCFGVLIGNEYRDGVPGRSNFESMKMDREYERALTGKEIYSDLIMETSKAYQKVPSEKSVQYTNTEEYQTYARPYSAIYGIIRPIYNKTVSSDFSYQDFQKITPDIAGALYDYRIEKIRDTVENYPVSEGLKEKIIALDDKVVKPFVFEYFGGYNRFIALIHTTGLISAFLVVFLVAPIFCGEYHGCDQLILSSKNGKDSLIKAKLLTGFSITAIFTLLGILLTYVLCMLIYGFDGKDAALQLKIPLSTLAITIGQLSIICAVCVFFACIVLEAITIFLSAKMKSSFIVITISGALIFIPTFINPPYNIRILHQLYLLLPSNMMLYVNMIDPIGFGYDVLGHIMHPYIIMPVFAIVVNMLLMPFSYKAFKYHQVE